MATPLGADLLGGMKTDPPVLSVPYSVTDGTLCLPSFQFPFVALLQAYATWEGTLHSSPLGGEWLP